MEIKTYKYQNANTRTTCFRGYVEWYDGVKRIRVCSPQVHTKRSEAEKDARIMATMGNARGKAYLLADKHLIVEG